MKTELSKIKDVKIYFKAKIKSAIIMVLLACLIITLIVEIKTFI